MPGTYSLWFLAHLYVSYPLVAIAMKGNAMFTNVCAICLYTIAK